MTRAASLSDEDAEAIVAATEDLLHSDGVSLVQVQWPISAGRLPPGLPRAVKALNRLAELYDKRLVFAPI